MTVVRTPLNYTEAQNIEMSDDGGLVWKQIIPMNHELTYKGRKLRFDRTYLSNIRTAFKANALGEQTAFQLADDNNRHDTDEDKAEDRNWDPERYRGEIVDMKVVNSGLWGQYKLTPEGMELVKKNPKLGVSASLKEGYERDGVSYPVVMRHCLGTLNPRIKGMSPWSSDLVTLSDNDDEEVLDFTMPTTEDETVQVPKEKWDEVLAFMKEQKEFNAELESALSDEDSDDSDDSDSADLSEDEDEDDPRYVELSERLTASEKRNRANENKAAAAEWRTLRASLAADGVPKAILDLAEPVMSTAGDMTINLSDDKTADPREIMAKMLDESRGYIDMSDETVSSRVVARDDKEDKELDEIVSHDFVLDEF